MYPQVEEQYKDKDVTERNKNTALVQIFVEINFLKSQAFSQGNSRCMAHVNLIHKSLLKYFVHIAAPKALCTKELKHLILAIYITLRIKL